MVAKAWKWLSTSKTQKTLTFVGSGLTVAVIGGWQLYLHFASPDQTGNSTHNITAREHGIAAEGNIMANAPSGGTAIVAAGSVTIGITVEQYEDGLRRREREIRKEISVSIQADEQQITVLQKELIDANAKLQRPHQDFENYKSQLAEAFKTLDTFKEAFAPASLDAARHALADGNTSDAERLFSQLLSTGKQGSAEAAYQLGVIAEGRVQYSDAARRYAQAATLDSRDPKYLYAAGRIEVELHVNRFRTAGDVPGRRSLQQAVARLHDSYLELLSRDDLSGAAQSLIEMGNAERIQANWTSAIKYYDEAKDLAQKAHEPVSEAKALMGMARAEMLGIRDYNAAAVHLEEAVTLTTSLQDRHYICEALEYQAENQNQRNEPMRALEGIDSALYNAVELNDKILLFYLYLDRADIYENLSNQCTGDNEPCKQATKLAKDDYIRAHDLAKTLGYEWLARQTEEFLRFLELRQRLSK